MIPPEEFQVVIPSRRRVESCRETVKLFRAPLVCVAEAEAEDYRDVGAPILTHPDSISGLGRLRQWILDTVPNRVLVQCNDDVEYLICLVGRNERRISEPAAIERLLLNAAEACDALGISCFSFNCTVDVRKERPFLPFGFSRLEGALFGMVGRKMRFDPAVSQFDDVNLSLECCLKERIIWQDERFAPVHNFQTKGGGNSVSRGKKQTAEELDYMKARWGHYLGVSHGLDTVRLAVRVDRARPLG